MKFKLHSDVPHETKWIPLARILNKKKNGKLVSSVSNVVCELTHRRYSFAESFRPYYVKSSRKSHHTSTAH